MSDNEDEDFDLDDGSFDDFEKSGGGGNTLGDLWRNNPLVKVGTIIGAGVLIFVVISFFGGAEEDPSFSLVQSGSEISAPPGTTEVTPQYRDAVEDANQQAVEKAEREGGSALPTPIETPRGALELPEEESEGEDPLQRWRRLQEERLERELQRSQQLRPEAVPEDTTSQAEAIQALTDAMAEQMQSILESRGTVNVQSVTMTGPEWLQQLYEQEQEAIAAAQAAAQGTGEITEVILLPAGEIEYAQLMIEANSDVPGPVLAQIVSGPLRGNRVLGSFEVSNEYLVLTFDTVVVDGESIEIDAIALDPDTTLPGMATEVDHRYLQRVVLPMAAAFVEGAAEAISESGTTTITIQGETVAEETEDTSNEQEIASGITEAGEALGEILDEMNDDVEILVRIEAGTPMGILFLEPVIQGNDSVDIEPITGTNIQAVQGVPGAQPFTGLQGIPYYTGTPYVQQPQN